MTARRRFMRGPRDGRRSIHTPFRRRPPAITDRQRIEHNRPIRSRRSRSGVEMEGLVRIHRRSLISACLVVALVIPALIPSVAAAGNTLRLDPATPSVATGGTFTVKVIVSAEVLTSGAQASITFDKTKVQVTSVTRGQPFAGSQLFLGADAAAIGAANGSGKLKTVAAAFLPPGNVPTGDKEFLIVGFKATACGSVTLGLPVGVADAQLLDGRDGPTYGLALKVTAAGGKVDICAPGAPQGVQAPSGEVLGATGSPGASVDPLAPGAQTSDRKSTRLNSSHLGISYAVFCL